LFIAFPLAGVASGALRRCECGGKSSEGPSFISLHNANRAWSGVGYMT
jgi:hypothetical protein